MAWVDPQRMPSCDGARVAHMGEDSDTPSRL